MQKEQKSETERLEALYKVSTQLGSTLDLSELLNLVIDAVIQLTEAERGFVVLVDEWGRLKTMAARNVEQETIGGTEIPISRTIVQRVVATGEPVLTSNAQEDARFSDRRSIIGYQFRSIMSAPLRARDRVTGAVFVDNHMLSGVFNDADLDLLVTFANQAAIAIDNARLFQQTDQALTRRVEELSLFQQIDNELHSAQDLERTLNLVLEWAINLTNADAAAVGILDDIEVDDEIKSAMRVKTLQSEGQIEKAEENGEESAEQGSENELKIVHLDHPTVLKMMETHDIVQQQNVSEEQSFINSASTTQLTVPVALDGTILGFIALESSGVSLFFEEDIEFIRRLSDRAAVAIGNSRLYEQLKEAIEDRTKFISIMTHELRLPLTSIRGYTDLMAKQLVGPLNEQQSGFMDTIQRNVLRMSRLISDLSDINRLESGRMTFDMYDFDLKAAVEEAADKLKSDIDEKKQTLTTEFVYEKYPIHNDYVRIVQIVENVIENAHKYTAEEGAISIRVGGTQRENKSMFTVTIKDNGLGMRSEERKKAFDQFYRSEDQAIRDHTGWGLGLSVVYMLVEQIGGFIDLQSVHGEGTEVTLLIPAKV